MVSQSLDGAPVMSGSKTGVQAQIRKNHPAAVYLQCMAHVLALALVHACEIVDIRMAIQTYENVYHYFRNRHFVKNILANAISSIKNESRRKKLKSLCLTRWIESADAAASFEFLFEPTFLSLVECTKSAPNADAKAAASGLVTAISTPSFIFTLSMLSRVMLLVKPLSAILQSTKIDVGEATTEVENVITKLKMWREASENETATDYSGSMASIVKTAQSLCEFVQQNKPQNRWNLKPINLKQRPGQDTPGDNQHANFSIFAIFIHEF